MSGRDGQNILRGGLDVTGGPIGVLLAIAFVAVVTTVIVAVIGGLDWVLSSILPAWLVIPVILLIAAGLVILGLYSVLRFNEWRRYR